MNYVSLPGSIPQHLYTETVLYRALLYATATRPTSSPELKIAVKFLSGLPWRLLALWFFLLGSNDKSASRIIYWICCDWTVGYRLMWLHSEHLRLG